MSEEQNARRVLLTGATGFVGRHVHPALVEAGFDVLCASRNPDKAARSYPDRKWVRFDIDDPETSRDAVRGVDRVVYLVHHLKSGAGYQDRERKAAEQFAGICADAGVQRLVYLGGVAPQGYLSRHLEGRLETGRLLRESPVNVVELRAGMIIGPGSASWNIVMDLAARLPVMVLPKWLSYRSRPVAIDDVVLGIVFSLDPDRIAAGWYDIPGPEVLSHAEMLSRAGEVLGKHPFMFPVPILSPFLSSYWIAGVTRTPLVVAQEIVQGLQADLIGTDNTLWRHLPGARPLDLRCAMRQAIEEERVVYPSPAAIRRLRDAARHLRSQAA